jgi:hypothetical protein
MSKTLTFVAAMKDYFNNTPSLYTGKPIEQTAGGFLQDMKALTAADRDYFKAALATVGYTVTN